MRYVIPFAVVVDSVWFAPTGRKGEMFSVPDGKIAEHWDAD
jgi:hypothetical protein